MWLELVGMALYTIALVFGIAFSVTVISAALYVLAYILRAFVIAAVMVWEILWPKIRPLPGIRHVHGYIIRRKVGIRRVL